MPEDFMLVPHYPQSNPGACLPACVRMVLAAVGDTFSEAKLAQILGSYEFGTPSSRVTRLTQLGYKVQYGALSLEELKGALENQLYPIIFLSADMLPWADFSGFHAVVLTEITDTDVTLHDPALAQGHVRLILDGFLMAWEEFDTLAALIAK